MTDNILVQLYDDFHKVQKKYAGKINNAEFLGVLAMFEGDLLNSIREKLDDGEE
jgi:hypothetical protein